MLVAGGGPAGIGAAVAASRSGARTLLVEQYGIPGGQATAGLVLHFQRWSINGRRVAGGIPWEFAQRISERSLRYNPPGPWNNGWEGIGIPPFDPEHLKYVAERMLVESGVEILYHTFVCGTLRQDGRVIGLLVENKSGRQALLAKVVIDATGDGDVAAFAGAQFEKGDPVDGAMQAMTMCFRVANADYAALSQHPMDASAQEARCAKPCCRPSKRRTATFGGPWIVPVCAANTASTPSGSGGIAPAPKTCRTPRWKAAGWYGFISTG